MANRKIEFQTFVDEVSVRHGRQLKEAKEIVLSRLARADLFEDIFTNCPYNDSLQQCRHGYKIHSVGNAKGLVWFLVRALEQFVFLASDFENPEVDSGKGQYALTVRGDLVLELPHFGEIFSLDGEELPPMRVRKLQRFEFVSKFGPQTEANWPSLEWVRAHISRRLH